MVEASDLFIVSRLLLMNAYVSLVTKEKGKTSRTKIRETDSTVVTASCLAMSSFELQEAFKFALFGLRGKLLCLDFY